MPHKSVTVVFLALLLMPALCGAITVSQSVDRVQMAYEDTAHLEISLTWDGSPTAYLFEKPLRLPCQGVKVTGFASTVGSEGNYPDEVTTKHFRFALVPTSPGEATIDAVDIEYLTWPDSVAGMLTTDPMTITVAEPLPVTVSKSGGIPGWLYIIIIGVVIVGGGAAFVLIRRKEPVEKPKSPVEAFLDELTQLKNSAGSDLKQFQTGLYQLLVDYISAEYHTEVSGRSAEAIAEDLKQTGLSADEIEKISGWLTRAEREKFAPVAAPPGESIRLEAEVRQLFESMR